MTQERRRFRRVVHRFEGSWQGASGQSRCTISDLSEAGCYVQSLAAPAEGDETAVTIEIGAHTLSLRGRVVYIERGMGFALKFPDVDAGTAQLLHDIIESLAEKAVGA